MILSSLLSAHFIYDYFRPSVPFVSIIDIKANNGVDVSKIQNPNEIVPNSECQDAYKQFDTCIYGKPPSNLDSYSQTVNKQCGVCSAKYQSIVETCGYLPNTNNYKFNYLELCHQENNEFCRSQVYSDELNKNSISRFDCSNPCHKYYANAFLHVKGQYYAEPNGWSPIDMANCLGNTCDKSLATYYPVISIYFNSSLNPHANITSNSAITPFLDGLCNPNIALVNSIATYCDTANYYGNITKLYCAKYNGQYCASQIAAFQSNGTTILKQFDCTNACHRSYNNWILGGNGTASVSDNGWRYAGACSIRGDIKMGSNGNSLTWTNLFVVLLFLQ